MPHQQSPQTDSQCEGSPVWALHQKKGSILKAQFKIRIYWSPIAMARQDPGDVPGKSHLLNHRRSISRYCQSAFNCDPLSASNFDPSYGTERQLRRSCSWTSSRRRSIPSFLCKLFLAAFPSLHQEKEFSRPDRGGKFGRRLPSWRVNVARFSTRYFLETPDSGARSPSTHRVGC